MGTIRDLLFVNDLDTNYVSIQRIHITNNFSFNADYPFNHNALSNKSIYFIWLNCIICKIALALKAIYYFCVAICRHFFIRNQRQVVNLFLMRCHDKMENIDCSIIFLKTISMQKIENVQQLLFQSRLFFQLG